MEDRERNREAGLRFGDMLRERLGAGQYVVESEPEKVETGPEEAQPRSYGSADGGERQPPPAPRPRDMNDVLRGTYEWWK